VNPTPTWSLLPSAPLDEVMAPPIHYACGRNLIPGWLNVDGFDSTYPEGAVDPQLARQIFRCDLAAPHPFPDQSFEWGHSEDFLEHLDQAESFAFLCEVYRTFRPSGVVRISAPGFAAC
jgi:predicted SAM-dependent methyltransferase